MTDGIQKTDKQNDKQGTCKGIQRGKGERIDGWTERRTGKAAPG